ncbi:hypothetical protein B296_00009126, partial [Ensete ventricosum]
SCCCGFMAENSWVILHKGAVDHRAGLASTRDLLPTVVSLSTCGLLPPLFWATGALYGTTRVHGTLPAMATPLLSPIE